MDERVNNELLDIFDETINTGYLFICNLNTRTTRSSKAAMEYFAISSDCLNDYRELLKSLVFPQDLPRFFEELDVFINSEEMDFQSDYRLKKANGEYVSCTIQGKIGQKRDNFVGTIVVNDMIISKDSITDLPTFYAFLNTVKRVKDTGEKFATLLVDLSQFHSVNVVYGYDFGNKLLYKLSIELRKMVSENCVYRLEGARFAFLLKEGTTRDVQHLFKQIKELVNHFDFEDFVISLYIYGGAVVSYTQNIGSHTYLSYLISSLERSKDTGRNELIIFEDNSADSTIRSLELLETVKRCIFDGCKGFYLCYQPFVNTIDGSVMGAEALVRWSHPNYGEVSPYHFIPHLETHPSFYELGLWILRQAIRDAKRMMLINPAFFINVNISYTQIEHEGFKYDVMDILKELNFPAEHLQLELTERIRNLDMDFLKEELNFFREHKVKIALDDFGTGSATLGLVCELPIDSLKIDQLFIRSILNNKSSQVIVDTILECASRLGIEVCLEGVENEEIREFLMQYQASYHQGYYYSKPVDLECFMTLINRVWQNLKPLLIKENEYDGLTVQNLLAKMPGGFFIYTANEEETIVEINETAIKMYGCDTLEEFVELTHNSFKGMVHPDDYPRIQREINEQIASSEAEMDYVEYHIICKNGETKLVRDYGRLVHPNSNSDLFYVFIMPMNQGLEKLDW